MGGDGDEKGEVRAGGGGEWGREKGGGGLEEKGGKKTK